MKIGLKKKSVKPLPTPLNVRLARHPKRSLKGLAIFAELMHGLRTIMNASWWLLPPVYRGIFKAQFHSGFTTMLAPAEHSAWLAPLPCSGSHLITQDEYGMPLLKTWLISLRSRCTVDRFAAGKAQ